MSAAVVGDVTQLFLLTKAGGLGDGEFADAKAAVFRSSGVDLEAGQDAGCAVVGNRRPKKGSGGNPYAAGGAPAQPNPYGGAAPNPYAGGGGGAPNPYAQQGGGGGGGGMPPPAPAVPGAVANPYIGCGAQAAVEHMECAICFEPLCMKPQAVFLSGGRRTCRHFFHHECVGGMANKSCPMCRAPFQQISVVPHPDADPRMWFRLVDFNGDGRLDLREVQDVVKGTLAVDEKRADQLVKQNWGNWDRDRNGTICQEEVMQVLQFARQNAPAKPKGKPPRLTQDKQAWFRYWDEDGSQTLSQAEVARAIVKTCQATKGGSAPSQWETQEAVTNIWPIFDSDGSGAVDMREFTQRDGLGDTLAASLQC